ncbi:MAG: pyridoxal 5'-phosphate synthase glutaminase subunit PdxT [Actinomycetota bacterium]
MGAAPIGVLALQGDVAEHRKSLEDLGLEVRLVKTVEALDGLGGIVLPGGESTAISLLLRSAGLDEPLRRAIERGLPTFGTCAGLVLLARSIRDGRDDQVQLNGLDLVVRRNGFGRQRNSFETSIVGHGPLAGEPLHAIFIRAPVIEHVGSEVEVLAELETSEGSTPVLVRSGHVLAGSFHPELTGDRRVHEVFAAMVASADIAGTL